MTTDLSWQQFGDPDTFALEFALYPDPDAGAASDPAESVSWAAFRVWADGRNLCEHQVAETVENAVHWYLLPFVEWLAANWDALLHEERLPLGGRGIDARHAYYRTVYLVLGSADSDSERKAIAWQEWWKRHALRACRSGGVFPDIFIRRFRNAIELSWGDQRLPGMPDDFYFTVPPGRQRLPASVVADALHATLLGAAAAFEAAGLQRLTRIAEFVNRVQAIRERDPVVQTKWFVEADQQYAKADMLAGAGHDRAATADGGAAEAMFKEQAGDGYIRAFSPAALMLASLNADIRDADAEYILDLLAQSYSASGDPSEIRAFVRDEALSSDRSPFQEGYDLALDFLEQIDLPESAGSSTDVRKVVAALHVRVVRHALLESRIRGLAIAGPQAWPTIVVNTAHPANRGTVGERCTIAHELCHVLHDRQYGRGVCLASGPWAPEALERRADAFAAMLLMPPGVIDRVLAETPESPATLDGITRIAELMETSVPAAIGHLTNIGRIDEPDRDLLLSEWDNRAA